MEGRLMKAAISFLSMLALLLALRCYPSVCQDDSTFELNSEMTNDGSNGFTVTIKDTEPRPRMKTNCGSCGLYIYIFYSGTCTTRKVDIPGMGEVDVMDWPMNWHGCSQTSVYSIARKFNDPPRYRFFFEKWKLQRQPPAFENHHHE